jgi:hypothetical protein
MDNYIKRFNEVVLRQAPLLFEDKSLEPWTTVDACLIDQSEQAKKVATHLLKRVVRRPIDLVGSCFGAVQVVSCALIKDGIKHIVTVGDVVVDGRSVFGASLQGLKREMQEGCDSLNLAKAHAWITLENGEVMDLTIRSSNAHRNCEHQPDWSDFIYFSSEPNSSLKHVPLMVGIEYQLRAVVENSIEAHEVMIAWARDIQKILCRG